MIDFIAIRVALLNADEKLNLTDHFSDITRDLPIEMHNSFIGGINRNISRLVNTNYAILTHVIDIDAQVGHVEVIPVSRTVKGNGLNVVIILNSNSLQFLRDRDESIVANHDVWLSFRVCGLERNIIFSQTIQ